MFWGCCLAGVTHDPVLNQLIELYKVIGHEPLVITVASSTMRLYDNTWYINGHEKACVRCTVGVLEYRWLATILFKRM